MNELWIAQRRRVGLTHTNLSPDRKNRENEEEKNFNG